MRYQSTPTPVPVAYIQWQWFVRRFQAAWVLAWQDGHDVRDMEVAEREAKAVLALACEKYKPMRGKYPVASNRFPIPPKPAMQALHDAYARSLVAHRRDGPDLDTLMRIVRGLLDKGVV